MSQKRKKEEKSGGNFLEKALWSVYAVFYDDMTRFYAPYRRLLKRISGIIRLNASKKNTVVLDAGCGTGEFSVEMAKNGWSVYAFDNSAAMLGIFRRKAAGLKNINIKNADLEKSFPYKNGFFDIVLNVHSLFMLRDFKKVLSGFDRVLKRGGILVIAHNRPVNLMSLCGKEFAENGIKGVIVNGARLFGAGVINMIISIVHRRVYNTIPAGEITGFLMKKGYRLLILEKAYRDVDDLIVMRKKR
ncbi:MAG TPA: SAM-dependent methyltransferase [bacterium]|nr:SAM-dependent methyltransferase [bacterium]